MFRKGLLFSLTLFFFCPNLVLAGNMKTLDSERFLNQPFDKGAAYNTFGDFYKDSMIAYVRIVPEKLQRTDIRCPFVPHTNEYNGVEYRHVQRTYPNFYTPTTKEVWDIVAWQTCTTWAFDKKEGKYKFYAPSSEQLPYYIDIAKGWKSEHRGLSVWYAPEGLNFGMDIYYLGHYTSPTEEKKSEFESRVRNYVANNLLKNIEDLDITPDGTELKEVSLSGYKALYWEPKLPKKGMRPNSPWRQWSVVMDGHAFLIVSAMDIKDKEKVFSDVDAMLKTFTLNEKFSLRQDTP